LLWTLQLEAVTYACQHHEEILPDGSRAGYLIGDGAGVGKGRTLAGTILENYHLNRKKAIWVTSSSSLKFDVDRDLREIRASHISVHDLKDFDYRDDISGDLNGCFTEGILSSTYSSLTGESLLGVKYQTHIEQVSQWCGNNFDGVVVFDESHCAKNMVPAASNEPSKRGSAVLKLQNILPHARIVSASATASSEPRNMAYMVRSG
jgi:hypothetical protein